MTTRTNFRPRRDQRRKDAANRQALYDTLTLAEKLQRAGAKVKAKLLARAK